MAKRTTLHPEYAHTVLGDETYDVRRALEQMRDKILRSALPRFTEDELLDMLFPPDLCKTARAMAGIMTRRVPYNLSYVIPDVGAVRFTNPHGFALLAEHHVAIQLGATYDRVCAAFKQARQIALDFAYADAVFMRLNDGRDSSGGVLRTHFPILSALRAPSKDENDPRPELPKRASKVPADLTQWRDHISNAINTIASGHLLPPAAYQPRVVSCRFADTQITFAGLPERQGFLGRMDVLPPFDL